MAKFGPVWTGYPSHPDAPLDVGRLAEGLALSLRWEPGRPGAHRHLPVQPDGLPPAPWSPWNELAGGEVWWVSREDGYWTTL